MRGLVFGFWRGGRDLHVFPGDMEMSKHDYTHCTNIRCPQASTCRRSTIHFSIFTPRAKWISQFTPDPETGICKYYWPLDTIELDIQTSNQEPEK